MKNILKFKTFENNSEKIGMSVENFLKIIGMSNNDLHNFMEKYGDRYSDMEVFHFHFDCIDPIAGGPLSGNQIAINQSMRIPFEIKFFIMLHEMTHCSQIKRGDFNKGYYETVVNGDCDGFDKEYVRLEKEANENAFNILKDLGFNFPKGLINDLKRNETSADMVYRMMSQDIKKFNSVSFTDLLKKQIGF